MRSIVDNFETLKKLWEWSLDNCLDTEMKARIHGIDVNMRMFNYLLGAYLGELILRHSDNSRKFLQNYNLSAVNGWCTASATVETLKCVRHDESFDFF